MTESQMERRYDILEKTTGKYRDRYNIHIFGTWIDIHNNRTYECIYTDDLQKAKRWIKNDMQKIL